jgi:hypothetical protein
MNETQPGYLAAPPELKHGDRNTYVNHKCRCPLCRRANADYMADLRSRRAERRRMVTY